MRAVGSAFSGRLHAEVEDRWWSLLVCRRSVRSMLLCMLWWCAGRARRCDLTSLAYDGEMR
jgi:hypothetical protein